ncbi:MAG: hypothetical protein NDF54_02635 [archaeon GB-1867-035]|nr:hypothetical protein [Candidatus Culexmicrobium profundum]
MRKNMIAILLTILTLIPTITAAYPTLQLENEIGIKPWIKPEWKTIKTDIITIIFPAGGRHPIFIWYYNEDNTTIHVVHFKGIWEYFTVNMTELIEFKRNLNLTAHLLNRTTISKHLNHLQREIEIHHQLQIQLNKTLEIIITQQPEISNITNIMKTIHDEVNQMRSMHQEIRNLTKTIRMKLQEMFTHLNEFNETLEDLNERSRQHGCDITENMKRMHGRIREALGKLTENLPQLLEQLEDATIQVTRELSHEISIKINETISIIINLENEISILNQVINTFFQHMPMPSHLRQSLNLCLNETSRIIHEISRMKELTQNLNTETKEITIKLEETSHKIREAEEKLGKIANQINITHQKIKEIKLNDTEIQAILNMTLNLSINTTHTLNLLKELNLTLNLNATKCTEISNKIQETIEKIANETNRCRERIHEKIHKAKQFEGRMREKVRELKELINIWHTTWHPPLFHFASGIWNLTNIENITTSEGEIIGLTFLYKLIEVPNPQFKFLENNLMLRCRFYYVPVEEKVDDVTYTVTRAELKVDFILQKWEWILDDVKQLLEEQFNLTISGVEGLALWIDIASLNLTKLKQMGETIEKAAVEIERAASKASILTNINAVGEEVNVNVNVKVNATKELEKPLTIPRRFGVPLKLKFISEDTTLGGFFKFINTAKTTYPNGTETNISVKAAYLEAGGFLRIYLCYPYFNEATLEHDPSIGLEVKEEAPIYTIEVPKGEEVTPESTLMIMTLTPLTTQITATKGDTVTVKVSLKDALGTPVEEASVQVKLAGKTYTATSIGKGEYEAKIPTGDLEAGEYEAEIYAEKEGYILTEETITIVISPRHLVIGIETIIITAIVIGAITTAVIVTRRKITKP